MSRQTDREALLKATGGVYPEGVRPNSSQSMKKALEELEAQEKEKAQKEGPASSKKPYPNKMMSSTKEK